VGGEDEEEEIRIQSEITSITKDKAIGCRWNILFSLDESFAFSLCCRRNLERE
jgi:hypothetical protein